MSARQSWSTWLVIVGVFVAGALGGAAARSLVWVGSGGPRLTFGEEAPATARSDRRRGPREPGGFQGRSARFAAYLQESLSLTPDQADRVGAILEARERETHALLESIEPRMREALERTESEIRDVLSDEQKVQFDELVKEGRRRHGGGSFPRGRGPSRDDSGGRR